MLHIPDALPLIIVSESLVWPAWAAYGLVVVMVVNGVVVPLLQSQAGKKTHWIFAYWPPLLLASAAAFLYAVAAVQTGDMQVIALVITTLVIAPSIWIVSMMTRGLTLLRRMTVVRHSNPDSQVFYARLDVAADERAGLQELLLVPPGSPIPDYVFLVLGSEGMEMIDASRRLERCFLVPWSRALEARTSGEVHDGSEFRAVSLEEAISAHEDNSRTEFLCTVLVTPSTSFSLRLSDRDADRDVSMISDLINTKAGEAKSGEPLVEDGTSDTSEYVEPREKEARRGTSYLWTPREY